MSQGWIKLHRKLVKWEWYQDSKMVHLFIHLILMANHEPGRWQGHDVDRGQIITGLKALKRDTGISIQSLRTCLAKLEKTQELTSKSTNRFRLITLCNYKDYQIKDFETNKPANKQLTNNQQTTNKQLTPNKNVKKNKNEEEVYTRQNCIDEAFKQGIPEQQAVTYFDHYNSVGWLDGAGRKITSLSSSMAKWRANAHKFEKDEEWSIEKATEGIGK